MEAPSKIPAVASPPLLSLYTLGVLAALRLVDTARAFLAGLPGAEEGEVSLLAWSLVEAAQHPLDVAARLVVLRSSLIPETIPAAEACLRDVELYDVLAAAWVDENGCGAPDLLELNAADTAFLDAFRRCASPDMADAVTANFTACVSLARRVVIAKAGKAGAEVDPSTGKPVRVRAGEISERRSDAGPRAGLC